MKITKSALKRLIKEELEQLKELDELSEEDLYEDGGQLARIIRDAIDDYQRDMTDHGSAEPFSTRANAEINALVTAVQAAMANPGPPVR